MANITQLTIVNIGTVDWDELREQKLRLLHIRDSFAKDCANERALSSILHVIDAIQDSGADKYGEEFIFGGMELAHKKAIKALWELSEAWDDDSGIIRNYPDYLPSFDEFVRDLDKIFEEPECLELPPAEPPAEDLKDVWGEDKNYYRADWKTDVLDGATNLGYWEWVEHQKEMNAETEEQVHHNEWDVHPDWPRDVWKHEVINNRVACSYWEWVDRQEEIRKNADH